MNVEEARSGSDEPTWGESAPESISESVVESVDGFETDGPPPDDAPSDEAVRPELSPLWRRLGAFAIDVVILAVPGFIVTGVLFDVLVGLGSWAPLIGFAATILYFGTLDGPIGHGQTPGKRVLGIRVVDRGGRSISFARAAVRSTIVAAPWFLGNLQPSVVARSATGFTLVGLSAGLGAVIVCLFVLNRRTRQSAHDLAVGAFVVRESSPPPPLARVNPIHVAVATFVGVACIFSPPLVIDRLGGDEMGVLLDVAALVEQYGEVDVVGASVMHRILGPGKGKSVSLVIETGEVPVDPSIPAVLAAFSIMAGFPDVESVDSIEVRVQQSANMGFGSVAHGASYVHSPAEWSDLIDEGGGLTRTEVTNEPDALAASPIDLGRGRVFSGTMADELLAGEYQAVFGRLSPRVTEGFSAADLEGVARDMFQYAGDPVKAVYKSNAAGFTEGDERWPVRRFYYLLESPKEAEGAPFYLLIDLTPDGDGLACLSFSVVSFVEGVPEGLE